MRRALLLGGFLAAVTIATVSADAKPLNALPMDIGRWSIMWMVVPQEMYRVGMEHGPVAAVTWGPAKGTAAMVGSTTRELWQAAQPDRRPGRRSNDDGMVFRYDF